MLGLNIVMFVSLPFAILCMIAIAIGWTGTAGICLFLFFLSSQIGTVLFFAEEAKHSSGGGP